MVEPAASPWSTAPDTPTLHELVSEGDRTFRLTLSVAADSPWLEGHFPERAVLPGVVQLRWAIEASRHLCPGLDAITGITNLKFRNPVMPPATLTLRLSSHADSDRVTFRYDREGEAVSSGTIRFGSRRR